LLRFARKTPKNRRSGDFLPCKLRKQPDYRGFFAASSAKNPQAQQAARSLLLMGFFVEKAIKTPPFAVCKVKNRLLIDFWGF
jgi:hypothetical protein